MKINKKQTYCERKKFRQKVEKRILERLTIAECNIDYSNGLKNLLSASKLYDKYEDFINPHISIQIEHFMYELVNKYDRNNVKW